MLERIALTNFAVARSVVLEPGPGLNIFTGETGAGKSLVVDALVFLFGGRRGREVIATGAERAVVEARLSLPHRLLTVERSVALSGRSQARIDGEPATLEDLRDLGARVVDIHGQSEQLGILRPSVQLGVLDAFAGLGSKREMVTAIVRDLREVRRQVHLLATDTRERERLIGQLQFETDEIASAALSPGEDRLLHDELARLANPARLLESAAAALEALESAPLGEIVRAIGEVTARDPTATELDDLAATLEAASTDLTRALRRYRDGLEEDPERLAGVQERLDLIARLCRKYGDGVDEVIAYGAESARRLAELTGTGASLEELLVREQELLALLSVRATELSRARRAASGDLVHAIAAQLRDLGMDGSSLSVGFACDDAADGPAVALPEYEVVITERPIAEDAEVRPCAFTESGVDRIEFLASFNPGESPRPLAAVASGGETSRFLLALTTVLGANADRRLVVLDEADEGVGGRAGGLIGRALRRLAERHQVLCITHLPQVAAFGGQHFVVSKQTDGTRTWSEVYEVIGEDRIEELAAMLGGSSDVNRQAARELVMGAG